MLEESSPTESKYANVWRSLTIIRLIREVTAMTRRPERPAAEGRRGGRAEGRTGGRADGEEQTDDVGRVISRRASTAGEVHVSVSVVYTIDEAALP